MSLGDTEDEEMNTNEELVSMYETVCSKLKSSNVEPVIDLYTLYAFVSYFLSVHILENGHFKSNKTNTTRLRHALQNISLHELVPVFFESGKVFNENINLTRAMDTIGFTDSQKNLLKRKMKRLFQKKSLITDRSVFSQEGEDDNTSSGEDNEHVLRI
jgi:hypothetical protein